MKKGMTSSLLLIMMSIMIVTMFPVNASAKAKVEGKYQPRKGQILVRKGTKKDGIFGHAEIIYSVDINKKNGITIGAMAPGIGVKKDNLQKWSKNKYEEYWILEVKGLNWVQQAKAADWCYKQIGKPYNPNFGNISTRKSFYCAQLVWAAYKDLYKIDMNTSSYDGFKYYYGENAPWKLKICKSKKYCKQIAPIELVKSKKTKVVYHYKK